MLTVSLFRDFITVNQYSGDGLGQDAFTFRLPQNFWFEPKVQQMVLCEAFSFIEGIGDLHLKSGKDILPSSLSPDFSKYVLFSSNTPRLSSIFSAVFDKVIDRSFVGFESFFSELNKDNYLYIDLDVDRIGFFCSTGAKKFGGYLDLSLQDFLGNNLEEFFSVSPVCRDSRLMMKLLGMALSKIYSALQKNDLKTVNIKKIIFGGAYGVYFDSLELKSLGSLKKLFNFDDVEKDLEYGIICKDLL